MDNAAAEMGINMCGFRSYLDNYLGNEIEKYMPHTVSLIGKTLALDFLLKSGSLENLVKYPAGTLQFNESHIHTLQELSDSVVLKKQGDTSLFDNMVIPMDFVFADSPKVVVKNTAIKNIMHGSDIYPSGIKALIGDIHKGSRVAIYSGDNELLAFGTMLVDSLNDLKAVDLDGILSDKYGENNVVRKNNRQKNIPVQKPAKRLHEHIRKPEARDNPGNGRDMFRKNPGFKGNPSKIRKRKNKF